MSHCLFVVDASESMRREGGLTTAEALFGETCQVLRGYSNTARLSCSAIVGGLSYAARSGLFSKIGNFPEQADLFQRARTNPVSPIEFNAFATCGNTLSLYSARHNLERLALVFFTDGLLTTQTTAGIRRISWAISGRSTAGLIINCGGAELPKCFKRIAKETWQNADRSELPLRLAAWIHDCLFGTPKPTRGNT